ncbi:hypothetical protein BD413DRAFT_138742 [Trametes elegans]|nr:hypothetical protein BD413DRAFT_138742 [Trametes elegans]
MASLGPETPAELAVKADFGTNIWAVFQNLYGDKWDKGRWNAAVARFKAAHDPAVVQRFWARAKLPAWDALEEQFHKGPPPFLRPGWKSPLLGKKVDLRWLDVGPFEHVKGSMDGWRGARVLIIEFWASWCRPCLAVFRDLSAIARTHAPDVKVVAFNSEGIFTNAPIDTAAVRRFIARRDDMEYPIFIDTHRVAVNSIFHPGQNLSIPLAFIITPKDGVVHWVGNPEEIAAPLEQALKDA